MIKQGDIVECLDNYLNQFTKGKRYVVKEVSGRALYFEQDDRGSTTNGWAKDNFKYFGTLEIIPMEFNIQWIAPTVIYETPKCECGKEKHGFANHTNWCDAGEK